MIAWIGLRHRAIFTLPVQDMYTEWLMDYLTATGNNAHDLEIKIYDMRQRHGLYRDFLIEE